MNNTDDISSEPVAGFGLELVAGSDGVCCASPCARLRVFANILLDRPTEFSFLNYALRHLRLWSEPGSVRACDSRRSILVLLFLSRSARARVVKRAKANRNRTQANSIPFRAGT